jgi:DNA polymerase III delta prime subunit
VLFYGAKGAGKRALAHALARMWLSDGEENQTAQTFDAGRSADFLSVEPMGASRIITVGQITPSRGDDKFEGIAVNEFLRTSPLAAARKVVLISDAERMNKSAANSLLKSLEEPHEYSKFILTTTSVGSILPTILSRCSAVACELPDESSEDPLFLLAEGSPGRLQDFQKHESAYRGIWQFAETLPKRTRAEALLASETLRDLSEALQKATGQNARASHAETLELLGVALKNLHPAWNQARQEIAEAHRRTLGNANASFVMDGLMARIL